METVKFWPARLNQFTHPDELTGLKKMAAAERAANLRK